MKNFLLLTLTLWCFFAHAQLSQQFIRVHNVADLATLINIASPMSGQIVFVVDKASIYQYDGTQWSSLGTSFEIIDGDSDTWIRVDDGSDNDVIEFTTGGQTNFEIDGTLLRLTNPLHSAFIGNSGNSATNSVLIGDSVFLLGNGADAVVAIGYRAMQYGTTGSDNTAIGAYSLRRITSGEFNTAVGSFSLSSNTTGSHNVAVGSYSLNSNTTGTNNVAIGVLACNLIQQELITLL